MITEMDIKCHTTHKNIYIEVNTQVFCREWNSTI